MVAALDPPIRLGNTWQCTCVRFARGDKPVGTGFLVPGGHILTCAHVVSGMMAPGEAAGLGSKVEVDFAFVPALGRRMASVVGWHPPAPDALKLGTLADIAVLRLDEPDVPILSGHVDPRPPERGAHFECWGFPAGAEFRGAMAEGRIGERDAGGWIDATGLSSKGYALSSGFSGAPVFLRTPSGEVHGGAAIGLCALADEGRGVARLIPASQLISAMREAINPYPGPSPFQMSQAAYFHGRDNLSEILIEEVEHAECLILTGRKGEGKSSILRAGVRPRALDRRFGLTAEILPSESGPEVMPRLLAEGLTGGRLQDLEDAALLDLAAARAVQVGGILILLDDADALLSWDPALAAKVLGQLTRLASGRRGGRIRVLLASSGNQEELLSLLPEDLRSRWSVRPIDPFRMEEIRAAIDVPASMLGVSFAANLPQRIAKDVMRWSVPLRDLQTCLQQLWEKRTDAYIREADYLGLSAPAQVFAAATADLELLSTLREDSENNALRAEMSSHADALGDLPTKPGAWKRVELTAQETGFLQRLTVFAGSFSEAAAVAVGLDGPAGEIDPGGLLGRLVQRGALAFDADTARYELGAEARAALEAQAPAERLLAARVAHAQYFTALAGELEPDLMAARRSAALLRLERERLELDRALAHSSAFPFLRGDRVRLAGSLFWYWNFQARFAEGRASLIEALEHAADQEGCEAWAKAKYGAGGLAFLMGDLAVADVLLREAVATWRGLPPTPGRKRWLGFALVILARVQEEFEDGKPFAEEAVEIFGELNDPFGLPLALNDLGYVVAGAGDAEGGRRYYARAIALWRAAEDFWGLALTLINYGALALEAKDLETARETLEEALKIQSEANDAWGKPNTLKFLGELELLEGRVDCARARYAESLDLHRRLGRKQLVADCLLGLARTAAVSAGEADLRYSARMLAASGRAVRTFGFPMPAAQLKVMDELEDALQAALGKQAFRRERLAGERLPEDEVVQQAIGHCLEGAGP